MNKNLRTYVAAMLAFTFMLIATGMMSVAVLGALAIATIGVAVRLLPRRT